MGLKEGSLFSPASKERIRKVLEDYSSKCSVNGMAFVRGTKYFFVRVLWTFLLVAAVAALSIHLGLLFADFLRYQKQSVTELDFSILPFPAVTVCNVNPIRMSKIDRLDPKLRQLIKSFDPSRLRALQDKFVPPEHAQSDHFPILSSPNDPQSAMRDGSPDGSASQNNTNHTTPTPATPPTPTPPPPQNYVQGGSTTDMDPIMDMEDMVEDVFGPNSGDLDIDFNIDDFLKTSWDNDGEPYGGPMPPPPGSIQATTTPGVLSGMPDGNVGDGYSGRGGARKGKVEVEEETETSNASVETYDNKDGSGKKKKKDGNQERDAAVSTFTKVNAAFMILYSAEPPNVRREVGHSLKELLVHCTFAGKACKYSDFKLVSSNIYGNCYTLQYENFMVANDGPLSGLDMILYLKIDDYIKGFTASKGAQVVVHQPGTVPFPGDEGFSVSAGMHSMIGLKMNDISRLGAPYGDCSDVNNFKEKYGIIYTRQTCQKLCQADKIKDVCKCFDATGVSLKHLLNFTDNIRPCRSEKERWCAMDTLQVLNRNGRRECVCNNPCKEKKYEKTISSRQWPDEGYAGVFVRNVCDNVKGYSRECERLTLKTGDELRQEFLKMSIYYEDLNYQQLSEVPNYGIVQLVSDIGGTLGLWIGLSLLGFCEILHLVISLFVALCCSGVKKSYTQHSSVDEEGADVRGKDDNKGTSPSETAM